MKKKIFSKKFIFIALIFLAIVFIASPVFAGDAPIPYNIKSEDSPGYHLTPIISFITFFFFAFFIFFSLIVFLKKNLSKNADEKNLKTNKEKSERFISKLNLCKSVFFILWLAQCWFIIILADDIYYMDHTAILTLIALFIVFIIYGIKLLTQKNITPLYIIRIIILAVTLVYYIVVLKELFFDANSSNIVFLSFKNYIEFLFNK